MLDVTEIAKLVRVDLKAAQKDGKLCAELKFSVRCSRFSLGSAIDVRVTGYTGAMSPAAPEYRRLTDAIETILAAHCSGRSTLYTDVIVRP